MLTATIRLNKTIVTATIMFIVAITNDINKYSLSKILSFKTQISQLFFSIH